MSLLYKNHIFTMISQKRELEKLSKTYDAEYKAQVTTLQNKVTQYRAEVDTAVTNFAQFAKSFGVNYKILKLHNPWLREPHLNNKSRKLYKIDIPKEGHYNVSP